MALARLRTEEEKSAIVAHCLELEQTGGDIIAYLWSQNYISPRATWCNFQREWLGRKPYQYTDGKPKKKKERKDMSRLVFTEEQKMEAARVAIEGKSPLAYLKGIGSQNPSGAWFNIKKRLENTHPEVAAKIPQHPAGWKAPKDEAPVVKVDGQLKLETPDGNTIKVAEMPEIIDGVTKEITVHEADMFEVPEGMVPLHMLKHPVKVNIVKDEPKITQPLMHSGKKAIGWEGDFGVYIYDRKHGYIDYESNDGEEISMPVDSWREWWKEIREVWQLMGVEL